MNKKEQLAEIKAYLKLSGFSTKPIGSSGDVIAVFEECRKIGEIFWRAECWQHDSELPNHLDWETLLQECEIPDQYWS